MSECLCEGLKTERGVWESFSGAFERFLLGEMWLLTDAKIKRRIVMI